MPKKTPVYHLDECMDCAHRHVCKYIDKIDNLLKRGTLPLDLQGASCNEYVPEDVIDESWKSYVEDEEDYPELELTADDPIKNLAKKLEAQIFNDSGGFEGMEFDGLASVLPEAEEPTPSELVSNLNDLLLTTLEYQEDIQISCVHMSRKTMSRLRQAFNANSDLIKLELTDGSQVDLSVTDKVPDWYFAIDIMHN